MKLAVGDKVMVSDVIDLNTSLEFEVTHTAPYGNSSSNFYEVTNGVETANIHISRLTKILPKAIKATESPSEAAAEGGIS